MSGSGTSLADVRAHSLPLTLCRDSKASRIQGAFFTRNADGNSWADEMERPASFWKSLERATCSSRQFLPVHQDGRGTGSRSYSCQRGAHHGEMVSSCVMLRLALFEAETSPDEAKNTISLSLASAGFRDSQQTELSPRTPRFSERHRPLEGGRSKRKRKSRGKTLIQILSLVQGPPYLCNELRVEVCKGLGTHYRSEGCFAISVETLR